jgi:hypothetical protein
VMRGNVVLNRDVPFCPVVAHVQQSEQNCMVACVVPEKNILRRPSHSYLVTTTYYYATTVALSLTLLSTSGAMWTNNIIA